MTFINPMKYNFYSTYKLSLLTTNSLIRHYAMDFQVKVEYKIYEQENINIYDKNLECYIPEKYNYNPNLASYYTFIFDEFELKEKEKILKYLRGFLKGDIKKIDKEKFFNHKIHLGNIQLVRDYNKMIESYYTTKCYNIEDTIKLQKLITEHVKSDWYFDIAIEEKFLEDKWVLQNYLDVYFSSKEDAFFIKMNM